MLVRRVLVFDPSIDHFSEKYVELCEETFDRGRTVLLVAPPGSGKTHAVTVLAMRLVSHVSPIVVKAGKLTSIHLAVPTHATLRDFASKLVRSFEDLFSRGYYMYYIPRLFILRGSIYSCVEPRMRRKFTRLLRLLAVEGLDVKEMSRLALRFDDIVRRASLDRNLMSRLLTYSMMSEVEMSLSSLCRACPRRRGALQFIAEICRRRLKIIDTERGEAERLLRELENDGVDTSEMCPYRAVLMLLINEPSIRRMLESISGEAELHLICTTHALKFNPSISNYLSIRYGIVERGGSAIPHLDVIDEADLPLLSPPRIRLPIYFATGHVDEGDVMKMIARYLIPDKKMRHAVKKMIELARQAYAPLGSRERGALKVLKIVKNLLKIAEQVEKMEKNRYLYVARSTVKKLGEAIANAIASGDDVPVEDLALYYILNKAVTFMDWLRRLDISRMNLRGLEERVDLGLADPDSRTWFLPELDFRFGIGRIRISDLSISLVEHAVRSVLDPYYPYAMRGKICLTATLSENWLRYVTTMLINDECRERIDRTPIYMMDILTTYRNVRFYRSFTWCDIDTYMRLFRGVLEECRGVLDRLMELTMFEARKDYLKQTSREGLPTAVQVLSNQACEIATTVGHQENVLLIYGTKSQVLTLATWVGRYRGTEIRNVLPLRIVDVRLDPDNTVLKVRISISGGIVNMYITHARGRWGRGIDLEQFSTVMIASPPLKVPSTVLRIVGKNPTLYPTTYIDAAVSAVQSTFRVIRRLIYSKPKNVFLDASLLSRLLYDYYPSWFRRLIQTARDTRVFRNLNTVLQLI